MSRFVLISPVVRSNAIEAVRAAQDGEVVTIAKPTRSSRQNAMFHSMVGDMVKHGFQWAGKRRNADEVKMLLISAHAVATQEGAEIVPGIEGEFVAIRESSAKMSVARMGSLITYVMAYCDTNGIPLNDTRNGGFMDLMERVG